MDESALGNRLYSYAFYGTAAGVVVVSVVSGTYALIALSAGLLSISGLFFSCGSLINNALMGKSMVVAYHNEYKLDTGLLALTRPQGNGYHAISVAVIKPAGQTDVRQETVREFIESIQEQFEYSILVKQADKRRLVDSLDTKRRMKAIQLSKTSPEKRDTAAQLKREIAAMDSEIESIRKSGRAFETTMKISAYGYAESPSEAARQSHRSLERICDAFAATARLDYEVLKGERLLEFMRCVQ